MRAIGGYAFHQPLLGEMMDAFYYEVGISVLACLADCRWEISIPCDLIRHDIRNELLELFPIDSEEPHA